MTTSEQEMSGEADMADAIEGEVPMDVDAMEMVRGRG